MTDRTILTSNCNSHQLLDLRRVSAKGCSPSCHRLCRSVFSGRPLGSAEFTRALERQEHRPLIKQKPGPKKRSEPGRNRPFSPSTPFNRFLEPSHTQLECRPFNSSTSDSRRSSNSFRGYFVCPASPSRITCPASPCLSCITLSRITHLLMYPHPNICWICPLPTASCLEVGE
jgi:hypothetical protein